jgi:hypothetical protein
MKTVGGIIAEKYNELIPRWSSSRRINGFTYAEKATWLIVTIRCEVDMTSFEDIFVQALRLGELKLAIEIMKKIGYGKVAEQFEKILELLVQHGFYGKSNYPVISTEDLPAKVKKEIERTGKKVSKEQKLWNADDKLIELYLYKNV